MGGWPGTDGWLQKAIRGRRGRLTGAMAALVMVPLPVAGLQGPPGRHTPAPAVPATPAAHYGPAGHHARPRFPAPERSGSPAPHAWPAARAASTVVAARQPAAGTGRVVLAGTPVFVQPASRTRTGPGMVAVTVASQAAARRLGITGVVFSVTSRRGSGPVTVGLDYKAFAGAYGGNFGSRLRLIALPACALTAPRAGRCAAQHAISGAVNLAGAQQVSATVSLPGPGQPVVLAATSTTYTTSNGDGGGDGGGPAGSYTATTLRPSGTWSAGGSAGDFTYDYPIAVPPAPSGLVPSVSLSYDSGRVDGQTSATQAQADWLGDGWSTPENYIEQSYVPCTDKPEGSAPGNTSSPTQDNCYDGQVLTLSLNGQSTPVVYDASTATGYTLATDNGDLVQKVTGSGNGTGSYDTSYWVITDRSGTRYYFGRNQLPGWSSGKPTTNSVDYEPVFAAHSGDPCYNTTWSKSVCDMAYRWNLDYVTDVHGNAMAYYYKQDSNAYLQDAAATYTSIPNANATYIRDSHLDHIDYGFTDGNAYSVNGGHAPDQVTFGTAGRCDPAVTSCPAISSSDSGKATSDYPDVPYDLNCVKGSACLVSDPTFWSTVELAGITTQQWTGTAYTPVDTWTFDQDLPATGDGSSATLFLAQIDHTGNDTSAGGTAQKMPSLTFKGENLQNRVNPANHMPAITRQRIDTITTEAGSVISVSYELASACTTADQSDPAANTGSCFPAWWTPPGLGIEKDWFNKWQVASVTQSDPSGGAPAVYTGYKYLGGAAWHYDDNELIKAKYRTYGQYRGFGDVQTFTGQGTDPQTETETTYYRGMSGDNGGPAVTLADSQGGSHADTNQLAGDVLETTRYNYTGGPVTSSVINSYYVSAAAATRDRTATGLPALTANATGLVETWTRQALHSGGTTTWRKTETDTSYYASPSSPYFGLPQYTYAHGDLSLSGNNQVRCTALTYEPANINPATNTNLTGFVSQAETDADPCGGASPDGATAPTAAETNALAAPVSVTRPADVVSATCTVYDDQTVLGQSGPPLTRTSCPQAAPAAGQVSETYKASGWTGSAFTWQLHSAAYYDSLGRVTRSWDGNGNKTLTSYTASSYGLTTGITTTNPLSQGASVTLEPMRGLVTGTTDPNGITTTTQYDGLGRVTGYWDASNTPASAPANDTYTYTTPVNSSGYPTGAPWAVTANVINDAGGYATSTTLYDGLQRVRQVQDPTPQGGRLVTDTFYDSRGWVSKTNTRWWDSANPPGVTLAPNGTTTPIPDSQVPNQTVTAYDGLGRPVLVTSYDDSAIKSQVATVYDQAGPGDGSATITVPLNAAGQPYTGGPATATVTDAAGRTSQLQQYTALPSVTVTSSPTPVITTVTAAGGTTQATDYAFDNAGHQTQISDETTGQAWTSAYNLLGQITSRTDPNAGTTTGMHYDPNGNLLQASDANGKTLSWTYDALNRKTAEYDAATTAQSSANELASWTYDNPVSAIPGAPSVTNPIGHLTTATRYIGGAGTAGSDYIEQANGFTNLGEPAGETISIPASEGALGTTYKYTWTYGAATGLPDKTAYPASPLGTGQTTPVLPAETTVLGTSIVNGLELPVAVAGMNSYGGNVTYTALGQVSQEEIGSLTVNAYITNTWDPHTGQLTDTNIKNTNVSATAIDDTAYTYDPAGNPLSQTETRQGTATEAQCYTYDTLDRLHEAWTTDGTHPCSAGPSTGTGGTVSDGITGAAYWTTWAYSPLGLRTTETDHSLTGGTDTVTSYTYDGNGKNQPDTLTSTSNAGPVTGSATYAYDTDGQVTSRAITTSSGTTSQQLTWNDDHTLATDGNSSYIYDANGNLLLQKDPGTTTLYLPNEELILNTATGAVTGTRYYPLPGGGTAVRTGASTYYFETTDEHGTAVLTLDQNLQNPVWRQYTPSGAPRGPVVTWIDNRGFLNKPADPATSLTSLGARWYDPATATFQSPDPLLDQYNPQQLNGYTYAAQNPATHSDPTGLWTATPYGGGSGSGCGGYHQPACIKGTGCNKTCQQTLAGYPVGGPIDVLAAIVHPVLSILSQYVTSQQLTFGEYQNALKPNIFTNLDSALMKHADPRSDLYVGTNIAMLLLPAGAGAAGDLLRAGAATDRLALDAAEGAPRALFSSDAPQLNADVVKSGAGLPRTAETVTSVAARAGVSLDGATVRIIEDPEYIRYLDNVGACACAPYELPGEIHLGPASFLNEELLANTLGHESEHLAQYAAGYVPGTGDLAVMEAEAGLAGQAAVDRLLGGG